MNVAPTGNVGTVNLYSRLEFPLIYSNAYKTLQFEDKISILQVLSKLSLLSFSQASFEFTILILTNVYFVIVDGKLTVDFVESHLLFGLTVYDVLYNVSILSGECSYVNPIQ